MRNVHSCENKKDEGENGKSQLRQMRMSSRCYFICVVFVSLARAKLIFVVVVVAEVFLK